MKREEYNELRSIKSSLKRLTLGHGTTLTIRTDASAEYKHKLDEFYQIHCIFALFSLWMRKQLFLLKAARYLLSGGENHKCLTQRFSMRSRPSSPP